MRQNGGFEKVDIMIIDKIIYNNKDESRQMETNFMLSFNAELNSVYPKRSKKERYEANKESITKQRHNFYQENRERLCLKDRENTRKIKKALKKELKNTEKKIVKKLVKN
jgi:hypothetical protein